MQLKKKFKRVLAISMAFSMVFCSNAFAADIAGLHAECFECGYTSPSFVSDMIKHMNEEHPHTLSGNSTDINLQNSTKSVTTDTLTKIEGTDYFADENNEWQNGEISEETRVKVDLASQFTVTIPKEIVLDGETGKADYKVKAVGDIAGDQVLNVVPDSDFILSEKGGKDNETAIVTQPNTQYTYQELKGAGTEYDGNISATLSAGEWLGKFNFNIEFKSNSTNLSTAHNFQTENDIYTCTECGVSFIYEMVDPF